MPGEGVNSERFEIESGGAEQGAASYARLRRQLGRYQAAAVCLAVLTIIVSAVMVVYPPSFGDRPGSSGSPGSPSPPTRPGFYVTSMPEESQQLACSHMVKATLANHEAELNADISARIGQILGAQYNPMWTESAHFLRDCCAVGTEYDHFLLSAVEAVPKTSILDVVDATSMLVVVDMQRDFTLGSFGQPCWLHGGDGFSTALADLIRDFAKKDAMIVASKDIHPPTHCSFNGTCKNTKDYEHMRFTADQRYVNFFPSHCSITFEGGKAVPQKGGETPFCQIPGNDQLPFCQGDFVGVEFVDPIAAALNEVKNAKPENVDVVYKGFSPMYDSFSVFPHLQSSAAGVPEAQRQEEVKWTGGWSLSPARKAECFAKGTLEDESCYPTEAEVENPSENLRSALSITKEKGIRNVFVVGLVYDFCIKETAIFATEASSIDSSLDLTVTTLADFTRPSFDGKPGMPYKAGACDLQKEEGQFCRAGGGTFNNHLFTFQDLRNNNVKVIRTIPDVIIS